MPVEYKLKAERLAALRVEIDKTRGMVAKDLDIEQSTYGKYELGIRQPSLEMLVKLAGYYGVSTDYLIGRSDERIISTDNKSNLAMIRRNLDRMSPKQWEKAKKVLMDSFDDFDWDE